MTVPPHRGFGAVSIRSASIIFLAFVLLSIGATHPARAADDGPALRCVIPPTGGIFIEWHGETGYTYFVQISNTDNPLARWTWAPLIESGVGQSISHEVESTPAKGFFRLKYTDQEIPAGFTVDTADFDQDGISNHDEIDPPYPFTGTDPLDADSDHDGLPDKYERDHGLDPNDDGSVNPNNGPDGDPDRDGLSNLDELNQGTDPSSADSDSDGVSDWDELFVNFTNPLTDIDSDGDGIPDDFEKHLARQLLAFQPDPVHWGAYYAGLAQGNLDATHDYTGDGIDAGELYIALRPIAAAGASESEFLVQPESRRNQLYASYRPATAIQPESSDGTYYHSQPYDFDAQIKLNDHEDFTSGYLTSRIGGLEWSNGYDSGMVPWYPHMATYYGSARSGYREQPDGWDPLVTNYGGDVRQTRFRVIATRVDHEPLNQRYLKIEGKGPYSEHVITEVLSAEPVSILIPKGRFLTDWYEFSALMVEGWDTVVKLVPVGVVPDYNRDGNMDEADRGKVTSENPWRFWINDDDDSGETGGTDISVDYYPQCDWWSGGVDGIRDLIDFFPFHFDLKSVLAEMPESQFQYFLKHESESQSSDGEGFSAATFNVLWCPEVILDSDPTGTSGAGSFLKNPDKAADVASRQTYPIPQDGLRIPDEILIAAKDDKGVVLVEACLATDKPLQIEIRKNDGTVIATIDFPVKISPVKDMLRYKFLMPGVADLTSGAIPPDPPNWPDADRNGKNFVFVHG